MKWVIPVRTLKHADDIVINHLRKLENFLGKPIKTFHYNKAGLYLSAKVQEYCREKGIKTECSATDAHQHNPKLENWNLNALQSVRTLLAQANMPTSYGMRHC